MNRGLHFVVNGWGEPAKMREKVMLLFTALLFFTLLTSVSSALPIGTETPITTQPTCSYLSEPALYGDKIVWEDSRDPSTSQIFIYDLITGEEYPVNTPPPDHYQYHPAIYENTVVWTEPDFTGDSSKIIRYDTATHSREEYGAHYAMWNSEYNFPRISGNTVVWQDYNTTTNSWDISVAAGSVPELIVYGEGDQKHPEIYQNYIVYENWTGTAYSTPSHIWQYNLSNHTAVPISEGFYQEKFPHIYGDKIVWEASNLSGDGTHIHVYNRGAITRLTPLGATPFYQFHPAIYGNRVVVEDARYSALHDVYVYDLESGSETRVSPKTLAYSQLNPDIYENRIVWADTRAGGGNVWDIYLFTLGPVVECPVAGFSLTSPVGPAGLLVTFTDTSQGAPLLHRAWDFGDGSPVLRNPAGPVTHDFVSAGIYPVTLTVGNPLCRNITPVLCKNTIYVDSPPDADFYGSPEQGFTPLTVHFKDTSCGAPKTWKWDFGDGSTSTMQNPQHTYMTPGSAYAVSLMVNNTLGNAATSTRRIPEYIRTLIGASERSITPVAGITADQSNRKSFLVLHGSLLSSYTIKSDTSLVISVPPERYGWQNITFVSSDRAGFREDANHTITGNFSTVYFHTKDLTATNTSQQIGLSYQFSDSKYPGKSITTSEIWEGALPADKAEFEYFASMVPPTGFTTVSAIPFTAHVKKDPLIGKGKAIITMSISSAWYDAIQETPITPVIIIGTGKDSSGNTVGAGLKPARYRAGGIDYFVADAPGYLTNFGLAQVSGSGNPFQVIAFGAVKVISQSGNPGSPAVVQPTIAAERQQATLPDPGTTARIYANAQGVISQATTLQSTDGLANVSLGLGTIARNSSGMPLPSLSIRRIPAGELPAAPPGAGLSFTGMAYDILPDGATFSPAIPLSYTIPQVQWGKEYVIQEYDTATGTWQALGSWYNPQTGAITVQVSHLCTFALFAKLPEITTAATPEPTILVASKSPLETDVEMYGWLFAFIIDNPVTLVIMLAALAVVAYFGWWKRRL